MKRSSKMVPFTILVVLAVLIAAVVTVKVSYPNLSDVYDVLGITSMKTATLTPDGNLSVDNASGAPSSTDSSINQDIDASFEPQGGTSQSDSSGNTDTTIPNDRLPLSDDTFEFNKTYTRTISEQDKQDKLDIFTVSEPCDYRVTLKTKISDDPLEGSIYVSVYDDQGILVEKQDVHPSYSNYSYCDEFCLDFHLSAAKAYTLKIHGDYAVGDYQIAITTAQRDAGFDQDSASLIVLGEETRATANNSLSDWFVLDITESAQYVITVHNIDVGCTLNVRGELDGSAILSTYVKNEDNTTRSFFARENSRVYIEIEPEDDHANGNYIVIVKKQED